VSGPLDGIRVVDVTHALAGPYCTMLLADLGADVIKIEPPAGDLVRSTGPFRSDDNERAFGGYFQSINRGKRSIVLDLKQSEDKELFCDLVADADVLAENFSVGVMDRFGLSYEHLRDINPRLVYASVRGFGDPRTGRSPYADWPAFDLVVQAMAGVLSITGAKGGPPMKVGPGVGDIFPGAMLALGIVSAVLKARTTGKGEYVDVAMFDAVLSLCERIVYQYSYTGGVPEREGNKHPLLSPFDLLEARDGWVVVAAPVDSMWGLLCELIGREDLLQREELVTNYGRTRHRDEVHDALQQWAKGRTRAEILAALGGRVAVGAVNSIADIIADPHVAARNMLLELSQPGSEQPVQVAGQPIKFTVSSSTPVRRAPLLNEHGAEIRAEVAQRRDHHVAKMEERLGK